MAENKNNQTQKGAAQAPKAPVKDAPKKADKNTKK